MSEAVQTSRHLSVAIRSEIHSSLVSGNGLVNVNKVVGALKAADKRISEIVQTTRLVSMAIRSEIYSLFVSGHHFVNVSQIIGAADERIAKVAQKPGLSAWSSRVRFTARSLVEIALSMSARSLEQSERHKNELSRLFR